MEPAGECEKGLLVHDARKATPPPFLMKTYMVVEDPATNGVVSWNEDGSGFVVWQPAEFARDLLPTLFKHSNFSSFIRQLNTYGFRKVTANRWEFCNNMFRKGERDLLRKIRRRKGIINSNNSQNHRRNNNKTGTNTKQETAAAINNAMIPTHNESDEDQRSSSTSSSSCLSTLLDENVKLKQENGVLNHELVSMRKKCKDLLDLVGVYANSDKEDQRPKLFGVRLGVEGDEKEKKRKRMEMIIRETGSLLSQSCK